MEHFIWVFTEVEERGTGEQVGTEGEWGTEVPKTIFVVERVQGEYPPRWRTVVARIFVVRECVVAK